MNAANHKTILPACLKKKDTIGLVAPAGPINEDVLSEGIRMLKDAGLNITCSPDILSRNNYLAGSDRHRLHDFHRMWADQSINAILAVRGGYGSTRIVNDLDFDLIRRNPKIFMGFSDITILLNTITQRTGLVTFHGPMLSTMVRDGRSTVEQLDTVRFSRQDDYRPKNVEILRGDTGEGRLIGGNLTSLVHLLGTDYEPNWQNAILLMEDINEPAYRVDRMLTHMKMCGVFDKINGIIMGQFLNHDLHESADSELIWQRVLELSNESTPVWGNLNIGHGKENHPLPIGSRLQMDSSHATLRFLENSCSML